MDNSLGLFNRQVKCPSCGFASDVYIDPGQLDEWLGGPQLVCPWCQGHSDRGACLLAGLPCGEAVGDGWQSGAWVGGPEDPHGRDPEEGTSRPYPWDGEERGGLVSPSATDAPCQSGFIPVSPIGVPPADDFGIVDDIGGDE